ncbi:MAG: hypothetical protein C0610_11975 [Desulfobacteraceae bacterium]|nr:MAG: hypothetical protein C0610_11975 [Desulfobacteraceae bacterium]
MARRTEDRRQQAARTQRMKPEVGDQRTRRIFRISDWGFKNKKSGVRIQNSGEKQGKLSSSKLVADDYWILLFRSANFILQQMTA